MDQLNRYSSREEAGIILAEELSRLNLEKPCLIAIPRGGVQVAEAVADRLKIPINTIIVKKLPVPGNPEAGFGAIAADDSRVLDEETLGYIGLTEDQIHKIAEKVLLEIHHRAEVYGNISPNEVQGTDTIIVDDGLATGHSMFAAIKSIKSMNPKSITAAIPVSSKQAYSKISKLVDNTICPLVEESLFSAVASYYKEWFDLPEKEIQKILKIYREKYPMS